MNNDFDLILNASLDEALRGIEPPDLTERIMAAAAARDDAQDRILEACLDELFQATEPPDIAARTLVARSQVELEQSHRVSTLSPAESRILDAGLQEIVSAERPPQLTERILGELAARQTILQPTIPVGIPVGVAVGCEPAPPPVVQPADALPRVSTKKARRRHQSSWTTVALSAAMLLAGVTFGILFDRLSWRPAEQPAVARANRPSRPAQPLNAERRRVVPARSNFPESTPSNEPPFFVQEPDERDAEPARELPPKLAEADVIQFTNAKVAERWEKAGVAPADDASDEEWIWRVYLRLVGRIPSPDEQDRFLADASSEKRGEVLDRLMSMPEFAEHQAELWTRMLVSGGKNAGYEEPLREYLIDSFQRNIRLDRLVTSLISATGASNPASENASGAVNYLLSHADEKMVSATSHVSRVFLGQQIQCARCHDHPTNKALTQNRFWEMNAFFRQMYVAGSPNGEQELLNRDFLGEGDGDPTSAEVFYETPEGAIFAAWPTFPGQRETLSSGLVSVNNRRENLARMISTSDDFARVMVNRVWRQLFGHGFTEPIDEAADVDQPSHPELLAGLANQLVAHDYDLRTVIRWICLGDTFGRSRLGGDLIADAPEKGTVPLFSRYYTQEMRPNEVQNSLLLLAQANMPGAGNPFQFGSRQVWVGQVSANLGGPSGRSGADEDIQDAMLKLANERTPKISRQLAVLQRMVDAELSDRQKIDHLFLAAVDRFPSDEERVATQKVLAANEGHPAVGYSDVWWALLNSVEYQSR